MSSDRRYHVVVPLAMLCCLAAVVLVALLAGRAW